MSSLLPPGDFGEPYSVFLALYGLERVSVGLISWPCSDIALDCGLPALCGLSGESLFLDLLPLSLLLMLLFCSKSFRVFVYTTCRSLPACGLFSAPDCIGESEIVADCPAGPVIARCLIGDVVWSTASGRLPCCLGSRTRFIGLNFMRPSDYGSFGSVSAALSDIICSSEENC